MNTPFRITWAILIMLLSSACGGLPREHRFEYQHLRALDPAETHLPEMDLIALYYSTAGDETHLRIDLLDFQDSSEFDLYIAFDSRPGGSRQLPFIDCASLDWDLLIRVPASGSPDLFNASLEPSLAENIRVQKDSTLDIISLSIPPSLLDLPGPVRLQVFTSFPGGDQVIDTLGPVLSDIHPPQRVNLLLTFWDVFSSHTPAQALRTWSGAHTGPSGERFGLHHLLDAVNETGIPVTLLDAKNPQTLAGLDYLGALGQVQTLDHRGLLTLPDSLPAASAVPEWLIERMIAADLDSVHAFGFSSSPITAMITEEPDKDTIELLRKLGYKALFSPIYQSSGAGPGPGYSLTRSGPLLLLPLPQTNTDRSHSSDRGLSVDWRKSLLTAAMEGGDSTVVSLGGDFSKTFWGDPQQSKDMLRWIAAHPWIHPVSPEEIIRDHFPAPEMIILDSAHFERRAYIPVGVNGQPISSGYTYDLIRALVQDGLLSFGNSPLAESAWRMYINTQISNEGIDERVDALGSASTLSESNNRTSLALLRANSIGRTGIFLSTLRWAQSLMTNPESSEQTSILLEDIDWDGEPEAILQNDWLFAVVTPEGGRLAALFGYHPLSGAVQLIGGRPHLDIGLSDTRYWDPTGGEIGEKTEPLLDGAFTSLSNAAKQFELIQEGDSLLAIHPDGHYILRYRLQDDQIMINISHIKKYSSFEIPLLLNPSLLRKPGWRQAYRQFVEKDRISWTIDGGPGMAVSTDNLPMRFSSFLDSPAYKMDEELPNLEVTQGHFLPFPMALITIDLQDDGQINISFQPRGD